MFRITEEYSRSKNYEIYKLFNNKIVKKHKIKDPRYIVCEEWDELTKEKMQQFGEWTAFKLSRLNQIINGSEVKYCCTPLLYQFGISPKIYSPETCTFIPEEIYNNLERTDRNIVDGQLPNVNQKGNNYSSTISIQKDTRIHLGTFQTPIEAFFAYKFAKEQHLKFLANKYYSIGCLVEEDYHYLMNLQIPVPQKYLDDYNNAIANGIPDKIEERQASRIVRPYTIIDPAKFFIGATNYDRYGTLMRIVGYRNANDIDVQFLDETGYVKEHCFLSSFKDGSIFNPYRRLITGGYFGEGPYKSTTHFHYYKVWEMVLRRAGIYANREKFPVYRNCTVCEEWYCFQAFAVWYDNYINKLNPDPIYNYQLDKDLFQWKQEYKIYSPNTCCILPDKLNLALVGNNIMQIKNLAEKYYSENAITKDVYDYIKNLL